MSDGDNDLPSDLAHSTPGYRPALWIVVALILNARDVLENAVRSPCTG